MTTILTRIPPRATLAARAAAILCEVAAPAAPAAASPSIEDHDELDGHTPTQAIAGAAVQLAGVGGAGQCSCSCTVSGPALS